MNDQTPSAGALRSGWALSGLAIAFLTFDGVLKFFLDKMPPEAMADSAKLAYPMNIMNPWPSHILFPVYLGVFIWLGLYLRMPALRAFVPVRKG